MMGNRAKRHAEYLARKWQAIAARAGVQGRDKLDALLMAAYYEEQGKGGR